MFSLTSQERKALLFVGALLILGGVLNYLPKKRLNSFLFPELKEYPSQISKININKAGWEELIKIPQIGEVLAQRIISYRQKYGPFQSLQEIKRIEGIGDKKLEAIKDFISLN